MKCIMVRHAMTDWSLLRRLHGQRDVPLNPQGEQQAAARAHEFARSGLRVRMMYSSDLLRAVRTANPVSQALGCLITADARLRECSYGDLEGYTAGELMVKGVRIADYGSTTPYDFRPFGGEHRDDVFDRHMAVLQEAYRLFPRETVMFVGHGRGLETLLYGLGHEVYLNNAAYYACEYHDGEG